MAGIHMLHVFVSLGCMYVVTDLSQAQTTRAPTTRPPTLPPTTRPTTSGPFRSSTQNPFASTTSSGLSSSTSPSVGQYGCYYYKANHRCIGSTKRWRNQFKTMDNCQVACTSDANCRGFEFYTPSNDCYHHLVVIPSNCQNNINGWQHYYKNYINPNCQFQTASPGTSISTSTPQSTSSPPHQSPTTTSPSSTPPSSTPPKQDDQKMYFTFVLQNDYKTFVVDKKLFEDKLQDSISRDMGVSKERLTISISEGSIIVDGEVEPGTPRADEAVKQYGQNFKARIYTYSNSQGLPLNADENSFSYGTAKSRASDSDEGTLLGLPESYWILIGMGAVAFILVIIAISAICCTNGNRNKKSKADEETYEEPKNEAPPPPPPEHFHANGKYTDDDKTY